MGEGRVEAVSLGGAVALERGLVKFEAETGCRRHDELAVLRPRNLFEEAHQPRHVLDRQPVGHRPDQMDVDLGDPVADDGQVESLRHAGDLSH